jgi:hypothetical protein
MLKKILLISIVLSALLIYLNLIKKDFRVGFENRINSYSSVSDVKNKYIEILFYCENNLSKNGLMCETYINGKTYRIGEN